MMRGHSIAASAAVLLIRLYRNILAPLMLGTCRFLPSCSVYAESAIRDYGAWRGASLASRRLWRCRPGGPCGYDPLPE